MLHVVDPLRAPGLITTLGEYAVILGETPSGKDVTLLRCFDRSVGGGLGTLGNRKIFANAVLVGFHGEGRDPFVSTAVAVFQQAPSWWGRGGVSLDESVKWPDATVHYRRPASVQVFDDGDLDTKIYATLASLASGADESGPFSSRRR